VSLCCFAVKVKHWKTVWSVALVSTLGYRNSLGIKIVSKELCLVVPTEDLPRLGSFEVLHSEHHVSSMTNCRLG
jgi:hypothetical protein